MKTKSFKNIYLTVIFVCGIIINSAQTLSQESDTLTNLQSSNCALQFQLIGGVGVYYINDLNKESHLRIGADVNLNHSDQSGDQSGFSMYTSGNPPTSSASTSTEKPDQTSNSYQIIFSVLYIRDIVEYKHTNLYCGLGPMTSYLWSRSTSKSISTNTSTSYAYVYNNTSENTTNSRNLGAMAMFGVNSQILDNVGLTAEISLSASYNWQTNTNSYTSVNTSTGSSYYSNSNGGITHNNGWLLSINAIRVGLLIGL
jgi:hypothetical protein